MKDTKTNGNDNDNDNFWFLLVLLYRASLPSVLLLLPDLPGTVRKRPIPMPRAWPEPLPLPLVLPGGPGSLAVSEMGVVASKALPDCSSTVNCVVVSKVVQQFKRTKEKSKSRLSNHTSRTSTG